METNSEEFDDVYYDSETEPSMIECDEEEEEEEAETDQSKSLLVMSSSQKALELAKNVTLYAVKFNNNSKTPSSLNRIFVSAEKAMRLCKEDPENRRFKAFKSFNDAYQFSYESNEIESGQAPSMDQVKASLADNSALCASPVRTVNTPPVRFHLNSPTVTSGSNSSSSNPALDAEKLPFSAPKKPEINQVKSFIEKNNYEEFRDRVIANPRYLMSGVDTPVTYQEAFHYNALHICARGNNHQICQLILNLLSNISYVNKLHRNDTSEQLKARSNHLLDLYLNSPEKGTDETPLHLATKLGSYEVAKLLLSFDLCNRKALNRKGQTPEEIICTKALSEEAKSRYSAIKSLFEDVYYLSVYRDEDQGAIRVRKPSSSLVQVINPMDDNEELNNNEATNSGGINKFSHAKSPCLSQHKLAGYVGPISPKLANDMYLKYKSPTRLSLTTPGYKEILRCDDLKGYERILRTVSQEENLPWSEYWAFLDSYCNFQSGSEGLDKLEIYLNQKKVTYELDQQIIYAKVTLDERKAQEFWQNKLSEFVDIVSQIKKKLELRENTLSPKFERFIRLLTENSELMATREFKGNELISFADPKEYEFRKQVMEIKDILSQYMTVVTEMAKSDQSAQVLFRLYRTSKQVVSHLKCGKVYENFYMSPEFRNRIKCIDQSATPSSTRSFKPKQHADMRDLKAAKSRLVFESSSSSSSSDNDSDKENFDESPGSPLTKPIKKMYDAPDPSDELVQLFEGKLKMTDSPQPLPIANNFQTNDISPENSSSKIVPSNFRNYIIGSSPSKFDRAVYLALPKDFHDSDRYPLVTEWYDHIKSVNTNDMNKWTTPCRSKD